MAAGEQRGRELTPRSLSKISMGYLVLLLLLAWAYFRYRSSLLEANPPWIFDPRNMLYIAWYGSIGGVMASITGLLRHGEKWNPAWNLWYAARPLTSAIVGVIGYLIYISIVQASLSFDDGFDTKPPRVLGYVIAFAIGYREDIFRELLQRVFEMIATAGGADTQAPSVPPYFEGRIGEDGRHASLTWGHATDNVAVSTYNIYRDQRLLATVKVRPPVLENSGERIEFADYSLHRGGERGGGHNYAVTAVDAAGNESILAGPIWIPIGPEGEPCITSKAAGVLVVKPRQEVDSDPDNDPQKK
ncbi:hypothetical protein [Catellatospora chokoriensis]|uniref:Uncharacterized protein n=1 Tax=Catellatospora chokoriensis TaxID=310353 RepID=A0A8J3K519_9ACTN|nr:hypothetical protein [Catellatospora chokoriensis]GIF90795.1 hypothetical protein Cch02nite_42390 [Catellatospora chokoriensis]